MTLLLERCTRTVTCSDFKAKSADLSDMSFVVICVLCRDVRDGVDGNHVVVIGA